MQITLFDGEGEAAAVIDTSEASVSATEIVKAVRKAKKKPGKKVAKASKKGPVKTKKPAAPAKKSASGRKAKPVTKAQKARMASGKTRRGPGGNPVEKRGDAKYGAKVRKARQAKGWTQRDCGERMGFTQATISNVESGTAGAGVRFKAAAKKFLKVG